MAENHHPGRIGPASGAISPLVQNPLLSYVLQKNANKKNVALALTGTRPALRQGAMEAALNESDPVRPIGQPSNIFHVRVLT